MYNELKAFERIVTPNRRLATFLNKQMLASLPEKQFYAGKILSWQDFLQDCWQEYRESIKEPKQLLSTWQSHYCWQQAINNSELDIPLLDTSQTVQAVKQAHSLLQQWRYDVANLQGIKTDTDLFLHWRENYQNILDEQNAIDESQLAEHLVGCSAPKNILLYGFDTFTPEQKHLFSYFADADCDVAEQTLPAMTSKITRAAYQNVKEEITSIALQIKEELNGNPQAKLPYALVVPQLSEHWRLVNDIFVDVFSPYYYLPMAQKKELPFNISAGQPLNDMPVIQAAQILFDLLTVNVKIQTWIQLCRTPFIDHGISEASGRAKFESNLRETQRMELSWQWILARKNQAKNFGELLQQAHNLLQTKPKLAKPSEWQQWFLQWLQHWGWPGERNLNSEEYQAVTHFYRLLNEFAGLDHSLHKVSCSQALSQLSSQMRMRMFQPESEDKPIQVLGMLEAAGQKFEKLWISGLSHDVWPQKPSPNPFIPTFIQIEQSMPHANAEREYAYAETMQKRLLTASKTAYLSYAKYDLNSDSVRLPSPLIQQYDEQEPKAMQQDENLLSFLHLHKAVEPAHEPQGIALNAESLRGGASILKSQAACPFQAYAKYRLQAMAPEIPVLGLSAKTKGNILHAALEALWQELKTQQALCDLDDQALCKISQQHLDKAIAAVKPALSTQQQLLEYNRALPLLISWLQLEKTRAAFHVQGTEVQQQTTIAGLPLSLRLDRIDALPDGSYLLIDYKTGDVKTKSWLGLRPDEPQLPLYARMMKTPPSGIAFGVLRKKKVELLSLSEENTDWQAQLEEWRQAIDGLANEFKNGKADIVPKYGAQTCQQCDLQLLCRVCER